MRNLNNKILEIKKQIIRIDKAIQVKVHTVNTASKSRKKLSTQTTLECIYTNVDGVVNKINELQVLVDKLNSRVVCLTDTKLGDHLNSKIFYLGNYSVFRNDKVNQAAPGGDVAVSANKKLVTFLINIS